MPSYFHCFGVNVWTEENDSNTLRADGYFFSKTEKKFFVFKNILIREVWTGPDIAKENIKPKKVFCI